MNARMILAASILTLVAATAQAEDFLGQTKIGLRSDSDSIRVSNCTSRYDGRYSQIRLKVKDAALDLTELSVLYGNGNWERILSYAHFSKGSETRWYRLRGAGRCIREIYVSGDASGIIPRQAKVQIFAR
jgi:hypothetical protein